MKIRSSITKRIDASVAHLEGLLPKRLNRKRSANGPPFAARSRLRIGRNPARSSSSGPLRPGTGRAPLAVSRCGSASGNDGFTLVELLLVLVILGILAAIVIPKFSGRTEQAKEQAAVTQISTFKTALDAFEVDNGYYPKGKSGLQDLIVAPRDAQNWRGPYMQTDVIPKDPWGNDYIYECPGRHNPTSYDLSSMGPPPGGEKVIANWTIQKR